MKFYLASLALTFASIALAVTGKSVPNDVFSDELADQFDEFLEIPESFWNSKANIARGCLSCKSGKLSFTIPHRDALAIILNNPANTRAFISQLQIGTTTVDSACLGIPTPTNRPTSHEITVDFSACGVESTLNGTELTYSGIAIVTAKIPTTRPGVLRTVKFSVPLKCTTNTNTPFLASVPSMDHIQPFGILEAGFDVEISGSTTFDIKPFFDIAIDTQVIKLTVEIQAVFRDRYALLADHCYATMTPSREARPKMDYIGTRGCLHDEGEFALQNPTADYQAEFEFAPISFEGYENVTTLFFHCNVNVCDRNVDMTNCQKSCQGPEPSRRRVNAKGSVPHFETVSAATFLTLKAPFVRRADGTIQRQ